jgi:hypothetical protein
VKRWKLIIRDRSVARLAANTIESTDLGNSKDQRSLEYPFCASLTPGTSGQRDEETGEQ